jgi:polar amino acid transport system substrate-binding protein
MEPNRLTGFEVDLATLLGQRLGRQARPLHGPWDKLLELLARGDFDLVINGIEVADEKRRVVELSRPYFAAAEVLTIRRADANAPRTLAGLAGRKIGTLPGSMAARIAEGAHADVRTYEGGQDDIYDDLKLGRLDGVLLDEPVAHYYGDLEPAFESVRGGFGVVQYAIAVRHEDTALLAQVNEALEGLQRDGSLRTLYERWGVWSPETAQLFEDASPEPRGHEIEFERWRAAVGKLPSLWERVTTRYPVLLPLFLEGAALTLAVSLCAMILAVVLGVSLALGRRFGPRPLKWLCIAYIEFFRGTPLLIQLTIVYFGLPELGLKLHPFVAGVVALGLNYAAAEAENYRAGLESVPVGQFEASAVLGLSTWKTLRLVVGPQAVRISIPPMTNDFIALLKDSSLVSVITVVELTKRMQIVAVDTRSYLLPGLLCAGLYFVMSYPLSIVARRLEERLARS